MLRKYRIRWNPVFVFFLFYFITLFADSVKINEFLYDPEGADTGKEWIELYNNSDEEVNLTGWKLQKEGANLYNIFTFPEFIMPPDSYLLVGESEVENTDFETSLALYNGSTTVAVRLVSADELYTDTVLYSTPNDHNLVDDNGNETFVPAVNSGNVLIRYPDGADTDDSEVDFFESSLHTPGESNIIPIDLAISDAFWEVEESNLILQATIKNLSTWFVDNSEANLDIYLNNSLIETIILPEIEAQDSVSITYNFSLPEDDYSVVKLELNYLYDSNLENNIYQLSYLSGTPFLIINEILFKPGDDNREWIEIFCRNNVDNLVDNFYIEDAGGGKINFSRNLEEENYYVISRYPDEFQEYYAIQDTSNVIEASSWTYLNTTTETLWLKDEFHTVLDSVFYDGSDYENNISIERMNPYSDENIQWEMCLAESGSTPLFPNSVMPLEADLELQFVDIWEENDRIYHQLSVQNIGFGQINQFVVKLLFTKNDETSQTLLLEEEHPLSDSLEIILETALEANDFITYHYEIEASEDLNVQNNEVYGFYTVNKFPLVINEIMYNPQDGSSEWLEIINNFIVHNAPYFYLKMDNLQIEVPQEFSYYLVTNNDTNANNLAINYDLAPEQVLTGLGTLTISGKTLSITDMNGGEIESFSYSSDWNNDQKGVSIERINPHLESIEANWGPCLEMSTPGYQNTLYIEAIPQQSKLTIQPNPFSPYRNEVSIFSYQLPEAISTATIRIFDLKGREIRKLVNQDLVASEGSIIWDGKDNQQRKVPIGIYIVKMEATARFTEKIHMQTKTVVVGK